MSSCRDIQMDQKARMCAPDVRAIATSSMYKMDQWANDGLWRVVHLAITDVASALCNGTG